MRKRYLFLWMLLFPLATMFMSGGAYAQEQPTDAEYEAALAAIRAGGQYYITTEIDGVKYYMGDDGFITDWEDDRRLFTFIENTAGGFKPTGFKLHGSTYFSNPASSSYTDDIITDDHINQNGDGRDTWEVQVFFLNADGKFAIRATNCTPATSGWSHVGSAFWTVNISEETGATAGYSYDPQYIWELEVPSYYSQVFNILNGIITTYDEQLWEDEDNPSCVTLGDGFGQCTDVETWHKFFNMLQEIYALTENFDTEGGCEWTGDPAECPSLEQADKMKADVDSMWQQILDSEIPYTMADGYYRIFTVERYVSKYDESGYVDKAIAASYDKDHENKGVYGTVRRDLANYVWKLSKSESGDSIFIQNVGMGTYISKSSLAENHIVMTKDVNDATHLMFDYAGEEFVQFANKDGEVEEDIRDVFAIRLASESRGGSYVHQQNHGTPVSDSNSPQGYYQTDSGIDQELQFWVRTYPAESGLTTDKWTSEWYLEPVSEEEVEKLVEDFEAVMNHDILVQRNKALREEVAEAITKAKDAIQTKMITASSQMDNTFGDSAEGTNIGNLIDNDGTTFWHTTWHGGVDPMPYTYLDASGEEVTVDVHWLQISDMENMVGDCRLYFREREGADNDRPSKVVILGTDNLKNEDDEWDHIATLTLPHTGKGEENTVPFTVEEGYPYIRLFAIEVNSSFRSFWHASEIQFYTIQENPNSQFIAMGEVATNLERIYNENCAIEDDKITLDDYNALLAAFQEFSGGVVDPTELRNALATYAKVTEGVEEGTEPGYWTNKDIAEAYDNLYAEVEAYNKAGRYKADQNHKYAVMLKAMAKSVKEKANGIKTDKWYRIMFPTEEMYDAYEFSKEGCDSTGLREDQKYMFGDFVTAGEEVKEETGEYNDNNEPIMESHLEAYVKNDVRESTRLYFMAEDEMEDKEVSVFRFVEQQLDGVDYVPPFQDVKENMSMALDLNTTYSRVDTLITKASQLSSNASDSSEGQHIEYLIDGKPSTFWHSDWHKNVIAPPYLQVALDEPVSDLIQVEITRRNNDFGHIVHMYIVGSNDAEEWTNIGYMETPYGGTPNEVVSSQPIDLGGSYKYLRFINTCRSLQGGGVSAEMDPFAEPASADEYDKTWTYFHAAEFQIYTVKADKELSTSAKTLQAAYTVANKIVYKDVTAEDLATAAKGYKAYQSEFNTSQGKAILPDGLDKAPASYAIQNKATGLFINANGGNSNELYLKTIPTFFTFSAPGYQRSLLHGTNIGGGDCTYLHAGESNRRLCTWNVSTPGSNSGLVIREAAINYADPEAFTFYKDIKPGRIADWCNSVSITPVDAPDDAFAYTAVGQYTIGEDEDAETYLALKAIETIEAGQPALYIYGDTTIYDAEAEDIEPVLFTMPGTPELVVKGDTINGLVGTLQTLSLKKYEIYFNNNYVAHPASDGGVSVTPCSAILNLDICPEVDPEGEYDFSICLGQSANEAGEIIDGVKDISSTFKKISEPGAVYSLDGKLLRNNATLNTLKSMGKGMYILNGVKVVVK